MTMSGNSPTCHSAATGHLRVKLDTAAKSTPYLTHSTSPKAHVCWPHGNCGRMDKGINACMSGLHVCSVNMWV